MDYDKFIKKCFQQIYQRRIKEYPIDSIIPYQLPKNIPLSNIYLEIYVHNKLSQIKIQQWCFITHKTLMKSINYSQAQQQDPQLDRIQIHQQSCFQILQNTLLNISPKRLMKQLTPPAHTLEFIIKNNENDLISFDGENTLIIPICDYQSDIFQCSISLKYNHQSQELEQQCQEIGGSCQFQLLLDPQYQKKKKQVDQQYRKLSEGISQQRHKNISPIKNKSINQDLKKIINLLKNVNFKEIQCSTLQQFLKNY